MDIKNITGVSTSLAPAARTATANGTGVDVSGFDSVMVSYVVGAITDGTHTPKIQDSDDNSTYADVAAGDLIGSLSVLAANTNQRVGYRGLKKWVRAVTTITGGPATGGVYAAAVIVQNPRKGPVA